MQPNRVVMGLACVATLALGYRAQEWWGVAGVGTAWVSWLLLHVTQAMLVLKRAARRPIGHVDSAVMLNARLQVGLNLLQVVGLARALGALQSPPGEQPELYHWTDGSRACVAGTFRDGKLLHWKLIRPPP